MRQNTRNPSSVGGPRGVLSTSVRPAGLAAYAASCALCFALANLLHEVKRVVHDDALDDLLRVVREEGAWADARRAVGRSVARALGLGTARKLGQVYIFPKREGDFFYRFPPNFFASMIAINYAWNMSPGAQICA